MKKIIAIMAALLLALPAAVFAQDDQALTGLSDPVSISAGSSVEKDFNLVGFATEFGGLLGTITVGSSCIKAPDGVTNLWCEPGDVNGRLAAVEFWDSAGDFLRPDWDTYTQTNPTLATIPGSICGGLADFVTTAGLVELSDPAFISDVYMTQIDPTGATCNYAEVILSHTPHCNTNKWAIFYLTPVTIASIQI